MKKVLLINPPFKFFPISMGYVLSCVKRAGIPVDFFDTYRPAQPAEYYMSQLAAGEYMAVGTGGFVYGINWFRQMLGQLRSLSPETPLILGGNITRNVRLEILLDRLPLDFAVVGEAESSFPQLLRALADGTGFETIPGVAFKDAEGNIVRNAPVRFALDQENVLPAYEEADLQHYIDIYRHHVAPGLGRAVPVLTGRGCKGGCSFCSPTVGRFKPRKIEHVLEEIEEWNRRYSFECFIFATEVFFTEDDDIMRFCQEYKKIRPHKPWGCSYRMDQSLDLLGVMKDAGCVFITAGLESGSETILPQLKHGCTVDQFRQTLGAARRVGMVLDSPFMMANENETEEDLKQTIDFVIDNKMDANFGLVGTYPGTPIYRRALKKGLVGDEWDFMTNRLQEWGWRSPSVAESGYFNISAMPTSRVFGHIYRQIRRYYTFQYNEFQARDVSLVSLSNGQGSQGVGLTGRCYHCGTRQVVPVRKQDAINVIEYLFRCPSCHRKNFLHFVDVLEARDYYQAMGKQLRAAERIIVFGVGKEASDFCLYDLFGLDLDRIVGFVDPRGAAPEKKFYHLPRYRLADLESVYYDLILVTDVDRNVAKLLLCTSTVAQSKPVCFLAPSKLSVPERRPQQELVGVGT